jgi:hypothetical protein
MAINTERHRITSETALVQQGEEWEEVDALVGP